MSFGATTAQRPTANARTLGQEPDQTTTNQAANPLPWFCGTKRLGVSWIDEVFNFVASPVYVETKKDSQQSGWSYSVGIGFALCHGPLDRIHRILFDRVQVWPLNDDGSPENEDGSPFEDPLDLTTDTHDIAITGYGTLRLHRGTDTQALDTGFNTATGHAHPAYRGVAWGWFETLNLGEGRTNLPNIEIISSRWPLPDWFDLDTARVGEMNINPIAALADFLQNPRVYFGWPDSRLDTDALNTFADDCATRCLGLSPYLVDLDTGDGFITRLCEHLGAIPSILADGTFTLVPIRTTTSQGTLDESDLTEPPSLNPEGLSRTVNQTIVNFTNSANWFRDDAVSHVDAANYDLTQELRSQTLDRPWITTPTMAQIVATVEGVVRALPQTDGSATVRLSSVGTILPGLLWRLSHGQTGLCGLPLRCESLTLPGSEGTEATIGFVVDKTEAGGVFVRPPDYSPPLTPPEPLEPAEFLRIVPAWPGQISLTEAPGSIVLCARTSAAVLALRAHAEIAADTYVEAGTSSSLALHGTLTAALGETITVSGEQRFRIQLDGADLTLPTTTLAAAQLDTVQAYIDDEVLSLYDITLISSGLYEVSAIRGRYGSLNAAHADDSDVFILVNRQPFVLAMPKGGGDQVFKVQPYSRRGAVDLADIDPVTAPGGRRSLRPLAPVALSANGQFHIAHATGDIALAWGSVPDEKPTGFWSVDYDLAITTRLEFLSDPTTVIRTETVAAGTEAFTYTAAMQSADSATGTITIRAWQMRAGLDSERCDTLELTLA